MIDHFTKYGWEIPLNYNKAETILTILKKCVITHDIPIDICPINEDSLKQCSRNFCESKGIARIYGVYINPQR